MTELRPVFYVSDGTGITAETIGHSVLTQFTETRFESTRISFVDTLERAGETVARIREAGARHGVRPIVINSCVDPEISAALVESGALMLDVFAPFIEPLERELGQIRQRHIGRAHGMVDFERYHRRIDAINFTLTHDDGQSLHYGVLAANYPLTEEDLEHDRLPPRLRPYRNKLFGLTIDPARLQQIRQERRPNSRYAQLETCRREVAAAEAMFRAERIPTLSTTHTSIEEIASKVLTTLGLQREMF